MPAPKRKPTPSNKETSKTKSALSSRSSKRKPLKRRPTPMPRLPPQPELGVIEGQSKMVVERRPMPRLRLKGPIDYEHRPPGCENNTMRRELEQPKHCRPE